jgi:uncharacterized membrane protein YgdD (TMEM256/DUF423 family)
MHRLWIALGALAGLLGVGFSAWAAHAAKRVLDATQLGMLDTAIAMLMWHGLALLGAGLWAERRGGALGHVAAGGLAAGMVLFCGALLSLSLTGVSLGLVAPVGGVLLMAGWAMLAVSALIPARRGA